APLRRVPSPGHAALFDVSAAFAAADRDGLVRRAPARPGCAPPGPAWLRATTPPALRAGLRGLVHLSAPRRLLRRTGPGDSTGRGMALKACQRYKRRRGTGEAIHATNLTCEGIGSNQG